MRDRDQKNLELLYEEVGVEWCAIILDSDSRRKLLDYFEEMIPSNWVVSCNHMTIDYTKPLEDSSELGKIIKLEAFKFYGSDEYMAVEVRGYPRQEKSQPPHVSIAEIPKSMESENHPPISFEREISPPIILIGTIQNLKQSRHSLKTTS